MKNIWLVFIISCLSFNVVSASEEDILKNWVKVNNDENGEDSTERVTFALGDEENLPPQQQFRHRTTSGDKLFCSEIDRGDKDTPSALRTKSAENLVGLCVDIESSVKSTVTAGVSLVNSLFNCLVKELMNKDD